jgi:abelson tyrosine-protein kinase 1
MQAANVLVDDDLRCVISDFGQSEMKTEVCTVAVWCGIYC